MTEVAYVTLRRGESTLRDLTTALDKIGAHEGVCFRVELAPDEDIDQDKLGGFVRDSETSRKAALDNFPRAKSQRRRVLEFTLYRRDVGCTADEAEAAIGLPPQSGSARMVELKQWGWVEPNGEQRPTRNGSMAAVMIATPKARDYEPDD